MYIAFESYLLTILNQKYMFRGSLIFLFMFTLLLGSCGTGLPSTLDDTLSIQGAEDELRETATLPVINLPDEVMIQIFSELSVKDIAHASGVCKHWHSLSEDPVLWKAIRLDIHGDYPASDATREQAKRHVLRVHVNTLSNFATIQGLVHKHQLNKQRPFGIYQNLLFQLGSSSSKKTNVYAVQGNEEAIHMKIERLVSGKFGYRKNSKAAVTFNDSLVEQGNEKSIERKIWGLAKGWDGYKKNPEAVAALNNFLAEQGNEKAIERKIWGLLDDRYGYTKDIAQLKSWIEQEAANGKRWACYLKAQGLKYGNLGFKKHRDAAIQYILKNNIPY